MSTTEADAKELIRELSAELDAGNYDAIEGFLADDYAERYDNYDAEAVINEERERAEAFADKREELDGLLTDTDQLEDGEVHLNAWYTVTGTHEGEFLRLPPTGNEVEFTFVRTFIVEDGAITRYRQVFSLGFLLNMGLDWQRLTEEVDMGSYLIPPEDVDE